WANREARRRRAGTGYRTWRWADSPAAMRGMTAQRTRASLFGGQRPASATGNDSIPQRRQLVGLEFLAQRLDDLVHRPGHDFRQGIQGQVDAVIGHPALREVVGADALGAVAR